MSTTRKTPAGGSPVPGTVGMGSVIPAGLSAYETSKHDTHKGANSGIRPSGYENHPTPTYKKRKEHLRELLSLGYTNLSEPGIPYWEPRREDESKHEHNARRQRECEAMDKFVKDELTTRSINDISASEDTALAENAYLQEQLKKAETRYKTALEELKSERNRRQAAEKEAANVKTSPEPSQTPHLTNILDEMDRLKNKAVEDRKTRDTLEAELGRERKMRKELAIELHKLCSNPQHSLRIRKN